MQSISESKEDLARKQQATPVAGTAPAAEEPATVRVRGPVVHEVIKEIEEIRVTPVIQREIIRTEIQQIIQPIHEVIRVAPVVERRVLPEEVRTFNAEVTPLDQTAIKAQIAKLETEFRATRGEKEERFIQMPAQVTETVRTNRIEEVIPVFVGGYSAPALADKRELHPDIMAAVPGHSVGGVSGAPGQASSEREAGSDIRAMEQKTSLGQTHGQEMSSSGNMMATGSTGGNNKPIVGSSGDSTISSTTTGVEQRHPSPGIASGTTAGRDVIPPYSEKSHSSPGIVAADPATVSGGPPLSERTGKERTSLVDKIKNVLT